MGLLKRRMARGLDWPRAELGAGEQVVSEVRANWSRRGVARGGTLFATESRLIFQPNSMEASIGLRPATWVRQDIKKIDIAPRGWNPMSGAIRRRLRITFVNGKQALFVVGNPEDVLRTLGRPA